MKKKFLLNSLFLSILFALICISFTASSCKKENNGMTGEPDDTPVAKCDSTSYPLVMAHGFLASGDTYARQALRFTSNGFCSNRIFTFDWNSVAGGNAGDQLDAFINDVLIKTGSTKVYLAGHSAGSNLGYTYCSTSNGVQKVAAYIHLAGTSRNGPAGPQQEIPTLNIYSLADSIVSGGDIANATNIVYQNLDHYQVATSIETFGHIYEFIYKKRPTKDIVSESGNIQIAGKALTLGENQPMSGAAINVFLLDSLSGLRVSSTPVFTTIADQKGLWGPFEGKSNVYYEFEIKGASSTDRTIHYYRRPFGRSDYFVYLRGLPPPASLPGILLSGLPKDDTQAVVGIFSSNQAVIHGRDELSFENTILSTATHSPPRASNIAFFLYDANNNKNSDGTVIPNFAFVPFLTGVDTHISAESEQSLRATMNGQTLRFKNWKSDSEGIVVLVFD
jgi:hypothetical protein